jgi:1-aminocyclopropane-1-carboxylate deaminase/D-cysteine desulfhydrase-like pyridoxal-dependent ACC family enzyme
MPNSLDLFFKTQEKVKTKMIISTPTEKINEDLFVKREDLACPPPGPPFGKVRGLYPVLQKLKRKGVTTVSYMDTSISMAGWGVSYFAKELGMKSIIFYPEYKEFKHNQEEYIKKWHEFGAEVYPLDKPNRQQINWYRARKKLLDISPNAVLLPQGLPFQETVESVSSEVAKNWVIFDKMKSVTVSVGSGVMLSGIVKGLSEVGLSPMYMVSLLHPKVK